jgi:hypothetical protein
MRLGKPGKDDTTYLLRRQSYQRGDDLQRLRNVVGMCQRAIRKRESGSSRP